MKTQKLTLLGATLLLLVYCAFQQLALGPSPQAAAAQILFLGVLGLALAAFIQEELWCPAAALLTTLAVYDMTLWVQPPIPSVLKWMFTALGALGALLYLSVSEAKLRELGDALGEILDRPSLKLHRVGLAALIPLWAAGLVLARTAAELPAPVYPREIHPAPPDQSDLLGKSYMLAELENPFRKLEKEDPKKFEEIVADGKKIYYRNCFFCHGDNLDGKGHFAPPLKPPPANFRDPGTIAMLQESFVFWRVSKGGPGLPPSGHPWNSAMPAWEGMLSEEDIWKSVLWIYSATGYAPRTWEKVEH